MKIAIVDDAKADRESLSARIAAYMQESHLLYDLTEFENAEQFLSGTRKGSFDIVFMDIYMGEMDGMTAAQKLYQTDRNCKIIFLTNSHEHSQLGYSVHAIYYLIKPIKEAEFLQAMEFCQLRPEYDIPLLAVTVGGIDLSIPTEDILYVEYRDRVTYVELDRQSLAVNGSFSEVTAPLEHDPRFLLAIRGVLCNMQHIAELKGSSFLMDNGSRLPINLRNKKSVEFRYRSYVFESMGWKK